MVTMATFLKHGQPKFNQFFLGEDIMKIHPKLFDRGCKQTYSPIHSQTYRQINGLVIITFFGGGN